MQRHQAHLRQAGCGCNSVRDSIRNVMEFQVEEHTKAQASDFFNRLRSLVCEKLAAYFEKSCGASQLPRQDRCGPGAVNVKGYD